MGGVLLNTRSRPGMATGGWLHRERHQFTEWCSRPGLHLPRWYSGPVSTPRIAA